MHIFTLDIYLDEINSWLIGRHSFSAKIINEILYTMAELEANHSNPASI